MNGFVLLSKNVGTPLFSKQFKSNFGLTVASQNSSENVSTLSDTSLSGLIFALKLNAQLSTERRLNRFQFNHLSIHFYEHEYYEIMSVVFMDTLLTFDSDEWSPGDFFAKEICDRFAIQYPKVVSNPQRTTRRKFDSFQTTLNLIWKDCCTEYLKYCIQKLRKETEDEILWMFLAYSHEYFSTFDCQLQPDSKFALLQAQKLKSSTAIRESKRSEIVPISSFEFDTPRERESVISDEKVEPKTTWSDRILRFLSLKTNRVKKEIIQYLDNVIGELQVIYTCQPNAERLISQIENALSVFQNAGKLMGLRNDHVEQFECQISVTNNRKRKSEVVSNEYITLICVRYQQLVICLPKSGNQPKQMNSQELMFVLHHQIKEMHQFLQSISQIADVSFREKE